MSNLWRRLLSLLLAAALLVTLFPTAFAAEREKPAVWTAKKVDSSAVTAKLDTGRKVEKPKAVRKARKNRTVRVSIVLEEDSALENGFAIDGIGENRSADRYRDSLRQRQEQIAREISEKVLGGKPLDVVWNLTLAANLISANVPESAIEEIREIEGVKAVVVENQYEPHEAETDGTAEPNMVISTQMTGAGALWSDVSTGAGTRIAIIDTGLDTDHQSFAEEPFLHALEESDSSASLMEGIDDNTLQKLNIKESLPEGTTVADLYYSAKVPFGFNYVDQNTDITHDNDDAGEHGSHVAGIAAANRYLKQGDDFVDAADRVHVVGNAPDAQLLVMKVFGNNGGAYDSDLMAAIEDAIVLECDAVNLSLGSTSPGYSYPNNDSDADAGEYAALLDSLKDTGMVMVVSSGNSGAWSQNSESPTGDLYADDINFQTGGGPGSFTNSLCVASADNDGSIGTCLKLSDNTSIFYTETTGGGNEPITTLDTSGTGTEYDFVFIDGVGKEEDYADIDLSGKIVLCSRGETNFSEKCNIAAGKGAAAVIIYNNQPGTISMDLSGYEHTAPCVSITQADGAAVKATASNQGTYYTGTIAVSGSVEVSYLDSDSYTMSDFSSWGVPGDLSLKPEITAPGGGIYSVNGLVPGGEAYESMSGTSMAAPQITGMVALLQQVLNKKGNETGLTDRALIHSLLMSTAVPMKDASNGNNYYPVIQQGAGFGRVDLAAQAETYITVAGQDDGKVKAELGEDADRNGVYTFQFTLHNLTSTDQTYELDADLFTQAIYESDGENYLSKGTTPLTADKTFRVNGSTVTEVTVPGSGEATVEVTLALTDSQKAELDRDYPAGETGAYLEAFVYANAKADGEGARGVSHSIPVLGFYGNWTDPSMFERGTYLDNFAAETDENSEMVPSYMGWPYANALTIIYGDDYDYTEYYFGGNPVVPDEEYKPERNALNPDRGDFLASWYISLIRNAADYRWVVWDDSGDIVEADHHSDYYTPIPGAFYYEAAGQWENADSEVMMSWPYYADDINDGDKYEVGVTVAPELYVERPNSWEVTVDDWDALGAGATLKIPAMIDMEEPQLVGDPQVNETDHTITVTAKDNHYMAAAVLYNEAGTKVLSMDGSDLTKGEGAETTFTLDLGETYGSKFTLEVYDYAKNAATYEIEKQIGTMPEKEMRAFCIDDMNWVALNADDTYNTAQDLNSSDKKFFAAAWVDGLIYATTNFGEMYVFSDKDDLDWEKATFVRKLDIIPTDMAYDKSTGKLYAVCQNSIYEIDRLFGTTKELGGVYMGNDRLQTNTLACDGNGNFYLAGYAFGGIFKFRLDDMKNADHLTNAQFYIFNNEEQSLEYDPNNGKLYWASYDMSFDYSVTSLLYEIDAKTGETKELGDLRKQFTALCIPDDSDTGTPSWAETTNTADHVELSSSELRLLVDGEAQLTAMAQPWMLSDRGITWSSDDESVATVDETGKVTAVSKGSCFITAAAAVSPSVVSQCKVIVEEMDVVLEGAMYDAAQGKVRLFTWDSATEDDPQLGMTLNVPSNSMSNMTWNRDDDLYMVDDAVTADFWDTKHTHSMTHILKSTGETVGDSWSLTEQGVGASDIAYSSYFSEEEGKDLIVAASGTMVYAPIEPMRLSGMSPGFSWESQLNLVGAKKFVAIASGGYQAVTVNTAGDPLNGKKLDTELVYVLDDAGNIWKLNFYRGTRGGYAARLAVIESNLSKLSYPGNGDTRSSYVNDSLAVGADGNLYYSHYTGKGSDLYRLAYSETDRSYTASRVRYFGDNKYPVCLFDAKGAQKPAPSPTSAADPTPTPEPDEPVTETTTSSDGTVTTTTTWNDGKQAVSVTTPEGEKTITVITAEGETAADVSLPAKPAEGKRFDDVQSGWYKNAVETATGYGLFSGTSATKFSPNVGMTRGMLVTVLHNLSGKAEYGTDIGVFEDVEAGKWYEDPVDWAYQFGVTSGTSKTEFSPNKNITREQLVTMLFRYADLIGAGSKNRVQLTGFPDGEKVAGYAKEAMQWAVAEGLISGRAEGGKKYVAPKGTATRAEVAAVLAGFVEYLKK